MQKASPLIRSTADLEWLRRSRLTNTCLLIIALIAAAIAGASAGLRMDETGLDGSTLQLALPLDRTDAEAMDVALDRVKERFGSNAVTRAVLLGRDQGISVPLLPD